MFSMSNFFFDLNADHRREIEARGRKKSKSGNVFIGAGIIEQSLMKNNSAIKNVLDNFDDIIDTINPDFTIVPKKEKARDNIGKRRRDTSKKETNTKIFEQRRQLMKSGEKMVKKTKTSATIQGTKSKKGRNRTGTLLQQWYEDWCKNGNSGFLDLIPKCKRTLYTKPTPAEKISFTDFCKSDEGVLILHYANFVKKYIG